MAKARKFGTFAGVYTPSLLTILGVIMYMRLGWVVGAAGLYSALAIILIAHIISVSTSLSISSIATDKKIQTGGIYYILSRSLGLPMGGAIGLTLFVGTALSISLYIIGFVESLLSIPAISSFLGMEANVDSFRILGSVVLVLLVIIAFISTSLALKMQFYIMAGIALSLVSIGLGLWWHYSPETAAPVLTAAKDAPPMEVIFGIFFPAVTGFTAGVAMSGDLQDPKRSIPGGTLLAVLTGFVVYMGLAIGFGLLVPRNMLLNNTNFISELSAVSALVFAGIWGATLSSALGGILGGPRILQAIAQDRIAPKWLAKGYGPDNEPRNALLFTFIISEIGILIGELNAIAGVVSMFYLASYAFINVAFTLEKWASTDFRPSFKIPTAVGVIGALAAFIVMFRLDMAAMAIALIIMWGIYFFLKRKEIKLEKGDVWQSVWSSIIRRALDRMDSKEIEERNWQPNIILFSGGTSRRPHLIEFGKALVGRYGMLSNFDLREVSGDKVLFPKHLQKVTDQKEKSSGVFTRQQSCTDIYQGIEMIARTYGFSGIEPNTVLMGWGRTSKNPVRFATMLKSLSELDLNILMLDYDKLQGFGDYKSIDIWWRGQGQHGNLALTLTRFIWLSEQWHDARVRLLIVNPINANAEAIYKDANDVIDHMRIDAEIRVINNEVEQKAFYNIIRSESKETDLIVLGIPDIPQGNEAQFVRETSELMLDIGTVLLIKSSSLFKSLHFGSKQLVKPTEPELAAINTQTPAIELDPSELPRNRVMNEALLMLNKNLQQSGSEIYQSHFAHMFEQSFQFAEQFSQLCHESLNRIEQRIIKLKPEQHSKALQRLRSGFLIRSRKLLHTYRDEGLDNTVQSMADALQHYQQQADRSLHELPQTVDIRYNISELKPLLKDKNFRMRWFARMRLLRTRIAGTPVLYHVRFQDLITGSLPYKLSATLYESLHKWGMAHLEYYIHHMRLQRELHNILWLQGHKLKHNEWNLKDFQIEREKIQQHLNQARQVLENARQRLPVLHQLGTTAAVRATAQQIREARPNRFRTQHKKTKRSQNKLAEHIKQIPDIWLRNQNLLYNAGAFELTMLALNDKILDFNHFLKRTSTDVYQNLLINGISKLSEHIIRFEQEYAHDKKVSFQSDKLEFSAMNESYWVDFKAQIDDKLREIRNAVEKVHKRIELITDESFNNYHKDQFEDLSVIHVAAYRLLQYLIDQKVMEPVQNLIHQMPMRLQQSSAKANDIVRLIAFTQQNEELEADAPDSFRQLLSEQKRKLQLLREKSEEELSQHLQRIDKLTQDATGQLTIYTFTRSSENLRQFVREVDSRKRFGALIRWVSKQRQQAAGLFHQLWFRKSEALMLAQSFQHTPLPDTPVNQMLNLVENLSPKPTIFTQIPFYYQQLLLKTNTEYHDFWYGREKELAEAQKAFERFRAGYPGGILISGDRNSGKTSLLHYLARQYGNDLNVYKLQAPHGGSIKPADFQAALQKALYTHGQAVGMLAGLSPSSILLIDELELWWEKSAHGMQVLQQLFELIEQFSHKILFLVSINEHAYRFISQLHPIGNYFLSLIHCSPFTAKQLYELILRRHNSTGMQLRYKNKENQHISHFEYANLFTRIFSLSKGNIGVALQSWVSAIQQIDDNKISIEMPAEAPTHILQTLSRNSLLMLVQFVLHRKLNYARLQRLMLLPDNELLAQLNFLKRSGLVREKPNAMLEIDRYVYLPLVDTLKEMELL